MADELIHRRKLMEAMCGFAPIPLVPIINGFIESFPAVDAVDVVRCKDCQHGVWDEAEGMYQCVKAADYDEESGIYYGFISHSNADFYCADGERRASDG